MEPEPLNGLDTPSNYQNPRATSPGFIHSDQDDTIDSNRQEQGETSADCLAGENFEEEHESIEEKKTKIPPFVIRVTAIAGLGGILFGYDLGVILTALPLLSQYFELTQTQEEWVVSVLYVGGFLGAMLGGSMCDSFGRKKSILITDVFFMVGALILYLAPSYAIVLQGRVVVGFAVAVSGIADVSYLHEIAPTEWRGSIVSVNEASISLGFLLAFGIGTALSLAGSSDVWRIMFGLSGFVALIQFMGMWDMPESPKWLRECGRHDESAAALARINNAAENNVDTADLATDRFNTETSRLSSRPSNTSSLAGEGVDSSTDGIPGPLAESNTSTPRMTGRYLTSYIRLCLCQIFFLGQQVASFISKAMAVYPRQSCIAFFMAITQQLCGQTSVLSFAPQIFASVSSDDGNASSFVQRWTTVSIGLVKFVITVLVIWKIETFGRRPLLLSGIASIIFGFLMLIFASGIPGSSVRGSKLQIDENTESNGASQEDDHSNGFFFAFTGILLVVCGYSMSFGPLTWLLTSEIFPTEFRGRALGASTIINFGTGVFVTSTFLTMQSAFGNTTLFGCYLLVSVLGFIFALSAIPETRNKNVEQINLDLNTMLWWRRNSRG